jgi:cell division protein FtsW
VNQRFNLGGASAFVLTACLLGLVCALQALSLWRAPAAWSPVLISITLKPGESITLGQRELAAPQADSSHLGLRRDMAGRWFLHNESSARQLMLQRDGVDRHTGSITLHEGQQFRIGAALFNVDAVTERTISMRSGGQHWIFDGATLLRDGEAQAPCPDAPRAGRLGAAWNRWVPHALSIARPLTFGGNLYCDNRLGLAHTEAGSTTLARVKGQLVLSSTNPGPLQISSPAGLFDLARKEEPLDGVTSLVAGRTRLRLSFGANGEQLELRPLSHVAQYAEARQLLPTRVQWQWRQRDAWALPAGPALWVGLGLCCVVCVAGALTWRRPRSAPAGQPLSPAGLIAALLATAGIVALLLQRNGTPPGIGLSIILGCCTLWCCLLLPGRLPLVTGAGILLLAVGMLAQLELGLGAMESSWLRHYQKTSALLAIGLGVGAHLRLQLRGRIGIMPQTRLEWMLALLALGALAALLLQVVFGDETGVFDLQPVEFAKLALTALTAHCIAIGLGWDAATPARALPLLRWFRLGAPALLFIALLALALVQVDDYSPLILLLVWSTAMGFAWSIGARNHVATAAIVGIACLAVGVIAWMRLAGAGEVAQWTFYGDRFMVWLDPAGHPHTGQQLLLGARAIAEGAWWGSDRLLGISTLGQPAGSALRIPAVQDDFAPSFFLNRHGLASALALWLLQALFLVGLLQTAARSYGASRQARDFRQAWLGRFRCFALCGGAAFVLGHFLLSWGTNLAFFPVMGQPMSFLSAGGSHLLFFICPLLAFSAISAQSLEEMQSCRSMSNTKS